MHIERPKYLNMLVKKDGNGFVKIITGVRRCGKSYLLFKLFKNYLLDHGINKDQILELAFDRARSREFRKEKNFFNWIDANTKSKQKYYLFLDEVQLLENFEEVLIDILAEPNIEIYVTGSNAKLLSKDIITEFRGRGDEIKVLPLSFKEYYNWAKIDKSQAYERFSVYGGMPATVNMDIEDADKYLSNLYNEIYINDIVERNSFRDTAALETIIDILSSGIGSLTNPKKIYDTFTSKGLSINQVTIRNYIDALLDAFIIHEAKRYDIKGRKYIGTPLKYYFCDIGLRNARMNFRQVEETHTMENIIFNELLNRGYGVDIGVMTTYEKNKNGNNIRKQSEIDFIANKGSKRIYVQSAFNIQDNDKHEKEVKSFRKLNDSFKKIVVLRDSIVPRYDDEGIFYIGILDFLLSDNI